MAEDKAKIDWKMLETLANEPAPAPAEATPLEAAPALASPDPDPNPAPAPAAPASKIVFYCPNGHRIAVPATAGGQRGKCKICGVAVRIPTTSQSPPAKARPVQTQAGGVGAEAAAEPPAADETSLTSPADDRFGGGSSQESPDSDDPQAVGHADSQAEMFSGLVTTSDSHLSATEFTGFSPQSSQADVARVEPEQAGSEGMTNPTAALMARLFQEMQHGGIVEVHITGGSVILPEFYEPRWSTGSHGLFASRAADDTVTLTAVAWDSIQKIIVRQVNGLPDGMFE